MRTTDGLRALRRSPAAIAGLAILLVLSVQAAYVYSSFEGDWTALFLTGSVHPPPPELAERTWIFDGPGYDGQLYRYIAHDPLGTRHWVPPGEEPIYRRRRILVPAVAFLFGAGQTVLIDFAYIGAILLSIFLGVLWTARLALSYGRSSTAGLLFLLIPATIISAQRMTIDVVVVTCTAGLFLYLASPGTTLLAILTAAALSRETGWLLPAAAFGWFATNRNWKWAGLSLSTVVPAGLWYLWLSLTEPMLGAGGALAVPDWVRWTLNLGLLRRVLTPLEHQGQPAQWIPVYQSLDALAWVALIFAIALIPVSFFRTRRTLFHWLALGHLGLFFLVDTIDFWSDPNAWARVFSPLFLAWMVTGWEQHSAWRFLTGLAPSIAVDLRLGFALSWMAAAVWRFLVA